jgi:hypothetical protein
VEASFHDRVERGAPRIPICLLHPGNAGCASPLTCDLFAQRHSDSVRVPKPPLHTLCAQGGAGPDHRSDFHPRTSKPEQFTAGK